VFVLASMSFVNFTRRVCVQMWQR